MASVVIVGGGIAGIAAADLLIRSGFHDVKILEATDRTGGRIWSVDVDDNIDGKAELGANYIHGIERNPIYKIADENDLLELRNKEKGLRHRHVYVTDQGDIVSKQIVQEVDWAYGMLMQQCEEFFHLDIATPCKNDSVGAFMEREYDRKVGKYSAEEKHIRQLIFNQRLAYEAVISGSDSMYDVSLGELGSYEELPGIHYTIPPGFEMVLEIIKRNIPPEDIVLNKPVTCICWNQGDKYESHHQVCVECEDGEKFYADHVIVTVSLGCLKYNAKRFFSPPLPKCKLDAIESLDIGTVGKVILEFDEAIFPPDVRRLELLWDKDHYDDCDKEMSKCWFRKIYSFEMIQENVVLGWLSGKECLYMETMSEEKLTADCVAVLEKFLKRSIPKPKKVIRTKWGTHPYTRGAYTYIPVGATVDDIKELGAPLPIDSSKPQVGFAGEATHPSFYSTTHGALLSGQREAERIINLYNQKEDDTQESESDEDVGLMF